MTIADRFQATYDYAQAHNLVGGFPNFYEKDYGEGVVHGTILLVDAIWRDIPASALGNPPPGNIMQRFQATYDYARTQHCVGGFPNFHQGHNGTEVTYGTILISDHATWQDVPASALGNPPPDDIMRRFQATYDYARRQNCVGGFPNFHQGHNGSEVTYGTILISDRAVWREIPADVLNMFSSWPFDASYTRPLRLAVLERHSFAYSKIRECNNLTPQQQRDLINAYRRSITHGVNTDPNANASAPLGGSRIDINFTNHFANSQGEQAQTLIHEMMHCANYTHLIRRDPPNPTPDVPGDGGQYYGSPPLQAEICIAGAQSDRVCLLGPGGACIIYQS